MSRYANMERVKELLRKLPNWKENVIKRQHKFVDFYLDNHQNIELTAKNFSFSKDDMLSIFLRIERQLESAMESMEWNPDVVFSDIPFEKRVKLIGALRRASKIENFADVFPEKLGNYLKMLIEYKDVAKVAEIAGIRKDAVVARVIGVSKPRKPSEKGAIHYIETYKPVNPATGKELEKESA